ncbi:MAG: hypothetical protein NTW86_11440 [Candidatus Sumerlaeota bacterium]|nr:hypothetical protein [Candidatus Sumerlaeota bacterium]
MDLASFAQMPEPPGKATATAILSRYVDTTAFRYYWSTEELRQPDLAFRPGPGSMSIVELLRHIHGLSGRSNRALSGEPDTPPAGGLPAPIEDLETLRRGTLENLAAVRARLGKMKDEDLERIMVNQRPFWFFLSGPLFDMLGHIGQVNSWRRLAGNPIPKRNPPKGDAPKKA